MSKRGLPSVVQMRHDFHYVEELSKSQRTIGRVIPLDKITPNPEQPRVEFGDLGDLVESIRAKGILEPLLVKPLKAENRWLIIAGERRWRAAQIAGLTEVPCIELDIEAAEIAEIALIENLQRKDLTIWEESDALASLSQRFSYTHEDIARRIGKSRSTVTESLTIAALPLAIRERCRNLDINGKSVILQVARQFDENAMNSSLDKIEIARNAQNQQQVQPNQFNQQNTVEATTTGVASIEAQSHAADAASTPNHNSNSKYNLNNDKSSTQNENPSTSFPVKNFNYVSGNNDSRLSLKFKKPVDKDTLIDFLNSVVKELKQ